MPWRTRVLSWLGLAAIFAAAVWSVRHTTTRAGPWPPTDPWCPQDMVIYQWAADAWARGASPWSRPPDAMLGACRVRGPFLYPSWSLPPIHALLGPLTLPAHAATVVGVLAAAGVAQLVAWGRWAKVNALLVVAAILAITRAGDRFSIGASPGNLEPMIALALTSGAPSWHLGYRRVGPGLMALAATIKPDHAPWLLAVGWAVGDLRRGAWTLAALVGVVALTEPLVSGREAFGWYQEIAIRAASDEGAGASTLAVLRATLPGVAGLVVWAALAVALIAWVHRAGARAEVGPTVRLLIAWLAVLLLLPRVKDYVWVTGYGPLLAAWWIQPWSVIALPIGEAVATQWPEHGAWVQALVTLLVLLTVQTPRQLAASLASGGPPAPQASPQSGTFGPPSTVRLDGRSPSPETSSP